MQSENNDCGPASLQMIFDYYAIPSEMAELKRAVKLSEKGSTMLGLKELAELSGLHAEGWRLALNDLSHLSFPALLFVRDNHFVVADSIHNNDIFMRDPSIGRLRLPMKQLTKIWRGEILLFRRE